MFDYDKYDQAMGVAGAPSIMPARVWGSPWGFKRLGWATPLQGPPQPDFGMAAAPPIPRITPIDYDATQGTRAYANNSRQWSGALGLGFRAPRPAEGAYGAGSGGFRASDAGTVQELSLGGAAKGALNALAGIYGRGRAA